MYMIIQHLFISALKLEQLMNRDLNKDGLTVKQFHLLWTVGNFDHAPSIKEAARELATSHQNVKQMALQLEKKGFLRLEKDSKDKRIYRLRTTQANDNYWKIKASEHDRSVREIFSGLSDEELTNVCNSLDELREIFETQLENINSI
jgi:DNA-binding MarR family transcriptional regulator